MSQINKLNKQFEDYQILEAEEMNSITHKIDEVIESTNTINSLIQVDTQIDVSEIWKDGSFRDTVGGIREAASYQILKATKVNRGDLILLNVKASANTSVLSEVSVDNNFIRPLVIGTGYENVANIKYVADKDMYVEASGGKILTQLSVLPNKISSYMVVPKGGYQRALYEAAGASFNESSGFYELNGLSDITEEQMAAIYEELNFNNNIFDNRFPGNPKKVSLLRTNIPSRSGHPASLATSGSWKNPRKWAYLCTNLTNLEKIKITTNTGYILLSADNYIGCTYAFYGNPKLKSIEGIIDISGRTSGTIEYLCSSCPLLEEVKIYGLKCNIKIKESPLLSKDSILYIISNSAATSPITITLHADAYAMAMKDEDIQAALKEKPMYHLQLHNFKLQ